MARTCTGSGRSPGEENGNPLQYSCLENGQRILVGYSPWGHKESDMTERLALSPGTGGGEWERQLVSGCPDSCLPRMGRGVCSESRLTNLSDTERHRAPGGQNRTFYGMSYTGSETPPPPPLLPISPPSLSLVEMDQNNISHFPAHQEIMFLHLLPLILPTD